MCLDLLHNHQFKGCAYTDIFFMKEKSEIFIKLRSIKKVEGKVRNKIQRLNTHNREEYILREFSKYLQKHKTHQNTVKREGKIDNLHKDVEVCHM